MARCKQCDKEYKVEDSEANESEKFCSQLCEDEFYDYPDDDYEDDEPEEEDEGDL